MAKNVMSVVRGCGASPMRVAALAMAAVAVATSAAFAAEEAKRVAVLPQVTMSYRQGLLFPSKSGEEAAGVLQQSVPNGVSADAAWAAVREQTGAEELASNSFMRQLKELRGSAILLGDEFVRHYADVATYVLQETGMVAPLGDTTGIPIRSVFLGNVIKRMEAEMDAAGDPNDIVVCEAGFYRGSSALRALLSSRRTVVYSYDNAGGDAMKAAGEALSKKFPGRFALYQTDAATGLSQLGASGVKCNVIFLDGDRTEEGVTRDILAGGSVADCARGHTLVLDDVNIPEVSAAWVRYLSQGSVQTDAVLGPSGVVSSLVPLTFGATSQDVSNALLVAGYSEMLTGRYTCPDEIPAPPTQE